MVSGGHELEGALERGRPSDAREIAGMRAGLCRRLFRARTEEPAVGRYRLRERIGEGGAGVVFRGWDPQLDRAVAVKLLRALDEDVPGRSAADVIAEARALASLSHRNIVEVYDVGVVDVGARGPLAEIGGADGTVFIVMELVEGTDLRAWLRARPRTSEQILAAFVGAGRGLEAAHDRGLVHRDFKPMNVLVGDDGRVRVADFGLTRQWRAPPSSAVDSGQLRESTGATTALVGTPGYMAPEQHAGRPATPASDQYAYCVSLYEGLFGERPFSATTINGLAKAKVEGRVPPPPPRSGLPAPLFRVLCRGLSPDPNQRFASMGALLEALRRAGRPRWHVGAAVSALLAAGLAVAWTTTESSDCEAPGLWDGQRRAGVHTALQRADPATAPAIFTGVDSDLAAWHRNWSAQRESACAAEPERQSERVCLDKLAADFDAAVVALAEVSSVTVVRARELVHALPRPERCVGAAAPSPGGEVHATLVAEHARLRARQRIGAWEGLRADLEHAIGQAVQADAIAVQAQLRIQLGQLHYRQGRVPEAAAELDEAAALASRSGRAPVEADARLARLAVATAVPEPRAEMERLAGALRAAVARAGSPRDLLALQEAYEAEAARVRGDYDASIEGYQRALDLLDDDDHPLARAGVLGNLARVLVVSGDNIGAIEAADASYEVRRVRLGDYHPSLASDANTLGVALEGAGREDEALAWFETGLRIVERTPGAARRLRGVLEMQVGRLLVKRGKPSLGMEHLRRAREIASEEYDASSSFPGTIERALGNALRRLGEREESRRHLLRALVMHEEVARDDPLVYATTLAAYASALDEDGRHEEAARQATRAVALVEGSVGGQSSRLITPLLVASDALSASDRFAEANQAYARAQEIAQLQQPPSWTWSPLPAEHP